MVAAVLFAALLLVVVPADGVRHLSLRRHAVPASRVFSHAKRPWMRLAMESRPFAKRAGGAYRFVTPRVHVADSNTTLPFEPLSGGVTSVGEYYAYLSFGGQDVRVQIDTGSSTLAVPLKDCLNCRPNDMRFDLEKARGTASVISCDSPACLSNSCGALPDCRVCAPATRACCSLVAPRECGFYLRYADGSGASGALVEAEVGLAGYSAPVLFGGILRQLNDFESAVVDGIFGLAYKSLACNPTCVSPLFDTLVNTGKVQRDVFSICTGRRGGTLTLGGNNPAQYKGELQYVPMSTSRQKMFYDVSIQGVEIGGTSVHIPKFSSGIVDSGTTVLVVTTSAYDALKKFFQSNYCDVPLLCPPSSTARIEERPPSVKMLRRDTGRAAEDDDTWFSPGLCVHMPEKYISMLPNISIVLENGVRLEIEPDVYMLKFTDHGMPWTSATVYRCLGIQPLSELEFFSNNVIIGDTVLQKYYYEIDRENNRVGFAESTNCVMPASAMASVRPQRAKPMSGSFAWWKIVALAFIPVALLVFCVAKLIRRKRQGYEQIAE